VWNASPDDGALASDLIYADGIDATGRTHILYFDGGSLRWVTRPSRSPLPVRPLLEYRGIVRAAARLLLELRTVEQRPVVDSR
jgi:hypothetical protein